mmetsp:Transcript_28676/g.45552  ORF Transcript_28676/g.45552 Transcript_28676/m.45552 type:complete len:531 (-) Transcript_28676:475-2067(-)|eukprot:CAMPEP_0169097778 /NCGR_PEP_ID=MMETSP1015-20121227/19693_1 /TAXON_ID=342587 /ORGANISM="Karlodinium micrum, Strain CCMP2283" /LENGTH=530 /DNA_ID=CAMNT_0009158591 /DNA_START=66 /DNA_END=1658 /DNA_ORIENTATION=-
MAPCDVFLPTCTLNVRRNSEPDCSIASRAIEDFTTSSKLDEFLEAINPGWSSLFVGAFAAARVSFDEIPLLDTMKRARLEEELHSAGAKWLHMKKLRKALDSGVDCSSHAEARMEDGSGAPSVPYQSPMTAYFEECDSFNFLSNSKSVSPVAEFNGKICFFDSAGNSSGDKENNEITSTFVDNKTPMYGAAAADGLPFKSPMSAYFDDGNDDLFGLALNSNYDSMLSLAAVPASPLKSQQTAVGPPGVLKPADKACCRVRSIRWADEVDEKKPLHLAELIRTPFKESCAALEGRVWEMSQDAQGCREVQKALAECDSDEKGLAISVQLKGHVMDAVRCPHANHVLRKIIETLPPACSSFIIKEILENGLAGVKEVAMHRYGCRIMEELLRVFHATQLNEMIELLLVDAAALCAHMYGNFVMKGVLKCASPRQRQHLVKSIMDNLTLIGTSFYACAVLAEVLQGDKAEGQTLALMILSVTGLLSAIVKNKHGRSVLEVMMIVLEDDQRRMLVKELQASPLKVVRASKLPKK